MKSNLKNCHYKSALQAFNAVEQAITAAPTPLTLAGSVTTDTGVALSVNGAGLTVNAPGLYLIAAELNAAATAAGTVSLALALNGVQLADSVRTVTAAAAGDLVSLTTVGVYYLGKCCSSADPVVSVLAAASALGTCDLVKITAVKLA